MAVSSSASSSSSSSTPQNHNSNTMNSIHNLNRNPENTIFTPLIPIEEPTEEQQQQQVAPPTRKRSKSPGIRLIGRRIYDSVHGKTCHQCRQKTMDFSVTCTNQIDGKQCTLNLCHICLFNRYGENAEEAAVIGDWKCPKCRGVCNCSHCMKKRGCCPTGTLTRAAKANGFSSVWDMLSVKGSEVIKEFKGDSSKKRAAPIEVETGVVLTKRSKKSGGVGKSDAKMNSEPLVCESGAEKNDNQKTNKGKSRKKSEKLSSVWASSKKRAGSGNDLAIGTERSHIKGKGLEAKKGENSPSIMKPKKKNTRSKKLEKSKKVDRNGSASIDNGNTMKNGNTCVRAIDDPLKMTDSEELVPEKVPVKIEGEENGVCNIIDPKDASLKSEITLPKGSELTKLADIDLPPEDIGNGLQFLEFCEAFGQVLDLKKGQPESLLRGIASFSNSGQTLDLSVAQFHIKLLSIIQEDSGNCYTSMKTKGRNLWTEALCKFVFKSESPSKGLFLGCASLGPDEYKALTTSEKLRLLIFLCDEALGTAKLRSWIDKQNSEEQKKAKEKEKIMKKKIQDEYAKATLMRNGAPLTISEHQNLVLKIKAEAAQTLAETLKATEMATNEEQRTDAVRSEPILTEDGRKFWKLRSNSSKFGVLLQDVCNADVCNGNLITLQEKWFAYNVQEISMVEKYISSPREQKDQGMEESCPSICMLKQEVI